MTAPPRERETTGLIAGFALWSLSFVALYGAHGAICATGTGEGVGPRAILIGLWLLSLAAQGALMAWYAQRLRHAAKAAHFLRLTALVLAVAAFVSTLWTGLPIIALPLC
jgi:hypothetical protein